MADARSSPRSWVLAAIAGVAATVLVPAAASGLDYRGNAGFHAGIEIVGALVGGAAAFALVVRYLAVGDRFELVIGLAFAVNAATDVVHGAIPLMTTSFPLRGAAELERFIPATYVAGRLAMATLLILAAVAVPRRAAVEGQRRREAVVAGVGTVVATSVLTLLMAVWELPQAVRPDWILARPLDAASAVLFAVAFVVLAREHARHGRGDGLAPWVATAAVFGVIGQTTMAFSESLYGPRFDVAHAFKILGYLVPLIAFIAAQVRGLASERVMTQRLRETDRLRAQLMRTVTHEFRTPLIVIEGFTDALSEESLTAEERAEYVSRLQRNARNLHRLIEEVLRFGEHPPDEVAPGRIDLARHVPRLVDQLEPVLATHTVETVTDGAAPVVIDAHALDRIATNLLTNAVRYAPEGTTVTVTVRREGSEVLLSVADEGEGVPEEERQLVFEPFYRGSGPGTLRHRGSGIGLAVVRQLVHRAGGSVDVQDTTAGGACFVVRFPRA